MSQTTAKPASPAPALGHKVVRGFSWMIAKTLGTKAVNFAGQIILAWLLVPQDFGLIGLAYTVTAFISVLQQAGLQEILIHRQSRFRRWANPVFWLSGCLGVMGMLLTLAAIPLATRLYAAPELGGILAILSINALVGSLGVVPKSKLSNELRFKTLATIGILVVACNVTVACLLAWAGWGAYAIAVGTTVSVTFNVGMLWKVAPVRLRRSLQIRRWRFIWGDSAAILATGVLWVLTSQGDYMVLGIFHTAAMTGLYFFAFNLSMQTVTLVTDNVRSVLFPALSQLQSEPKRQIDALLRSVRLLALVAVPACLMQAAVADPLIRLVFPAKWYGAIPVMQILCIGMAFRAVGAPGGAMILSQGRFKFRLILYAIYAACYLTFIITGALIGGIVSVAIAEAVYFVFYGYSQLYAAIFPDDRDWTKIVRVFIPPLFSSILALLPGMLISELIPWITAHHLLRIVVIIVPVLPIYVMLMRLWSPRDCAELWERFASRALGRLRPGRPIASA